jgi:hypothetical protein
LQALDAAALVHAHHVGYLVLDLGSGVHGGRDCEQGPLAPPRGT